MEAEIIEEPVTLSKVPEPAIAYTLPTVEVGNMDGINEYVRRVELFFEDITIDPTDKEQVKALKALNADVNKAAKAINGKRLEMDKAVKGAIAEADGLLNGLRDRLQAVAERNKGMLAEAEELWRDRRYALLQAEYEGLAPDLMAVIDLSVLAAAEPKLMQHSWGDAKACKELGELVAQAVEGRKRLKAMGLQHEAEADYEFCHTLDLAAAIDRDTELKAEAEEKARFAQQARELERRIEFVPVEEPEAPAERSRWVLSFIGTDADAVAVKECMVRRGVAARTCRREAL